MCWSGLPITKQNGCLNLLKSTTIQCHKCYFFGKGKKKRGNVLELQRRGLNNKLSGNCSGNYKFLQDNFKWGLWQLGTQTGWLMGLLTCREVALRKLSWHMRGEWSKQMELSTFWWLGLHVPPCWSTPSCSIIVTLCHTNCCVPGEHFCISTVMPVLQRLRLELDSIIRQFASAGHTWNISVYKQDKIWSEKI